MELAINQYQRDNGPFYAKPANFRSTKIHQPDNRGNQKHRKSTGIECLERQCLRLVYPECPGHISSNGPGSTIIEGGDKDGGKHEETRRWHAAGTSPCFIEDSNPDRFWTNLNSHQKLNKIYEEIVHWKPIFFNIFKNKTGEHFLKCLETTLQPLAENTNHQEMSMQAAMVLPHLSLARTTDHRDGSVNKLPQKRRQLWMNGDFDNFLRRAMHYRTELKRNENHLLMRRKNSTDK